MQVYQELHSAVSARLNCIAATNKEWQEKHEDKIEELINRWLPHGSGIDNGIQINLDLSTKEKLVFTLGYHHMDENGYYCGWTYHDLIVKAGWTGPELRLTGRDRNDIKEYLYEALHYALTRETTREVVPS